MYRAKSFAIIIPSYNEIKNIEILIKKIKLVLPNAKVFIIDDSNTQVNSEIKKIINIHKQITLISRHSRLGRGTAIIRGFKEALKYNSIKYIFEMDSDLAHNPREFKRFIKKMGKGNFDLIIGSRYLSGSRIVNIAKNRTILSRIINIFLRIWLGVGASDFTSGFRLYSRKCANLIIASNIRSTGFITLSEILYKVNNARLSIAEVPITWNYRLHGKSNVNLRELMISLYFVIKMRIYSLLRIN